MNNTDSPSILVKTIASNKYVLHQARRYFIINLNVDLNLKGDIEKLNDSNNIDELTKFCRKLMEESEKKHSL